MIRLDGESADDKLRTFSMFNHKIYILMTSVNVLAGGVCCAVLGENWKLSIRRGWQNRTEQEERVYVEWFRV